MNMADSDQESELTRLIALYKTYDDEALVQVNPSDLTDIAKSALRQQLATRNLKRDAPKLRDPEQDSSSNFRRGVRTL
jgi:hypothetical protein